jgi:spoIIIJ-associated protein
MMGMTVNLEVRRRDDNITIKIFSDHNAVLIGKNGRAIEALQTIVRQIVHNETNEFIGIILDVENYKEKRVKNLEYLAKKVAKEVKETKVETKLDSMNSYERRIIHNVLTNNKKVYTESEGEEPNRCVVIKPKDIEE